jgi:hypothetical protein
MDLDIDTESSDWGLVSACIIEMEILNAYFMPSPLYHATFLVITM